MPPADSNNNTRPRKPLSPYNLFYRYKRAKIIEANSSTGRGGSCCMDKNDICHLVATPPGLENLLVEDYPTVVHGMITNETRRANVRRTLQGQLFAKDTTKKRRHRKSNHGYQMTFVEMNKLMVTTWKEVDDYSKSIFQELAKDGKREYNELLVKYNNGVLKKMNERPTAEAEKPSKKHKLDHSSKEVIPIKIETSSSPATGVASIVSSEDMMNHQAQVIGYVLRSSTCNSSWEPLPVVPVPTGPFETLLSSSSSTGSLPLTQFGSNQALKFENHSENSQMGRQNAAVVSPRTGNPAKFSPEPTFISSIQPLPLHYTDKSAISSVFPTSSGLQSNVDVLGGHKAKQSNISVDDFMKLIATLDDSL